MKALSIQLPWAWLVAKGFKPEENRGWRLPYKMLGQRIYIHASKTIDGDAWEHIDNHPENYGLDTCAEFMHEWYESPQKITALRGCLIAKMTLIGSNFRFPDENANLYSVWSVPGQYQFLMADPEMLPEPIPYRGELRFFEVNIPRPVEVKL